MKVALIGGAGFIGLNLCDALLAQGHAVNVFDRPGHASLASLGMKDQLQIFEGDFLNPEDLSNAMLGCEIVFHLVSTTLPKTSNENQAADVNENVIGSIHLMEEAKKNGVHRVIFISSGGTVYGRPTYTPIDESHPTDPVCSYGITKLMIEKYFALHKQLHDQDYMILRLSNPFGEHQRAAASQGAIAVFLGKVMRGESIEIWGDGSVKRDYLYAGDMVDAMLSAMTYTGKERLFNIGSGQGKTLLEVLECIGEVTELDVNYRCIAGRSFDVPVNVLSIDRAKAELGWTPSITFENGLKRMFDWFKTHSVN